MSIEISLENFLKYGSPVRGDSQKELNPTSEENDFLSIILPLLPSDVVLERRSHSYLSLLYDRNDFLRFKLTSRAKWLSLFIPPELREKYKDSPLFTDQKKKSLLHWKAKLSSLDDVEKYKELIVASCRFFQGIGQG